MEQYNTHDAVLTTDHEGIITYMNPVAEALTGWKSPEGIGQPLGKVFHALDDEHDEMSPDLVDRVLKDRQTVELYEHISVLTREGDRLPISGVAAPMQSGDQVRGLILTVSNLPHGEETRDPLTPSDTGYADLANKIPGVFYRRRIDQHWTMEFISQECELLTGYPAEKLMQNDALTYASLIHPDDWDTTWQTGQQHLDENECIELEYRILPKAGDEKWVLDRGCVQRIGEDGKWYVQGFIVDVTEWKNVDSDFRDKLGFYRTLLSDITDAVFVTDDEGAFTFICPNVKAIFGYQPHELDGKRIQDLIGDDIMENGELEASGEITNAQTIVQSKDGTEHQLLVNMKRVRLGRGTRLFTCRDISDRAELEKQIQARTAFLESIFTAAPVGIGVLEDRIIQEVNRTFCDITGYTEEELLGADTLVLYLSEEEYNQVGHDKYSQINQYGYSTVETRWRCKDGTVKDIILGTARLNSGDDCERITMTVLDITQRKTYEKELQREHAFIQRITETSPIAITIVNQEGRIVYANAQAEQTLGLERDEITQRNYNDPNWQITDFDGEPYPDEQLPFQRVMERKAPVYDVMHAIRWPSGEMKYLKINGAPLTFGKGEEVEQGVFVIEDMTELVLQQRQLLESQEHIRKLWERSPDAMCLSDSSGILVDVNPALCELASKSREELCGIHYTELVAIEQSEISQERYEEVFRSRQPEQQVTLKTTLLSGESFYLQFTVSFMDSEEHGSLMLCIIRDVTEQKLLEKELIHSQRMEALGQIAGGIAHDFNNVLTSISGAVEMMQMRDSESRFEKYLHVLNSSIARGKTVTERMLTFTRSSTPETKPLSVRSFLEDIQQMASYTLPKYIEIALDTAGEPLNVLADPNQLQQVLLSLCVNAADAMPQGGTISFEGYPASDTEVEEHIGSTNTSYACIAVRDTGVGMDRETQSRIFEPFFTTKKASEGTGLGLAVAHKIIRLHNGWITVESREGEGTIFTIGLPRTHPQERSPSSGKEFSFQEGEGETILIVEDEKTIGKYLEEALVELHYTILWAPDAAGAKQFVRNYGDEIDLILTDIGLPDQDGAKLVVYFGANLPDIPVIAATGYVDDQLKETLYGAGVTEVIRKPYDLKFITNLFRDYLKQSVQIQKGRGRELRYD